jgi:hypothetical protein
MNRIIDHTGKKYGRLTVIRRTDNRGGYVAWLCLCDCGTERAVLANNLARGTTVSCGCYRKESTKQANKANTKHGWVGTYQYKTWGDIKSRCYNEKHKAYPNYGGRGIKIYYRWKDDPAAFCEWLDRYLGPRPEGHSLDRINNDGDYEPRNLRWADASTQLKNRRKLSR